MNNDHHVGKPGGASPAAAGSGAVNNSTANINNNSGGSAAQPLDKKRLQELVKEVDPHEQLDEDVEELLLEIADDFIEQAVGAACTLAKHRKASAVDVRDVLFVLEKNWNLWLPAASSSSSGGSGEDVLRPFRKSAVSEAHKARMALIRKTMKKY